MIVDNIPLYYQPAAHHQSDGLPLPRSGSHTTLVYCNCLLMYILSCCGHHLGKTQREHRTNAISAVGSKDKEGEVMGELVRGR
jgi:hypothetical protein